MHKLHCDQVVISHNQNVVKIDEHPLAEDCTLIDQSLPIWICPWQVDAIQAMKILVKKFRGVAKDHHMIFIDLEEAFDRIPRDLIWTKQPQYNNTTHSSVNSGQVDLYA